MFDRSSKITKIEQEIKDLKKRLDEKERLDSDSIQKLTQILDRLEENLKRMAEDHQLFRQQFSDHEAKDDERFSGLLSEIKQLRNDANTFQSNLFTALQDHIRDSEELLKIEQAREDARKQIEEQQQQKWNNIKSNIKFAVWATGIVIVVIVALINGGVISL